MTKMVRLVALAVIFSSASLLSASSAFATPGVSGEFPVPLGTSSAPAVASNGKNFLVATADGLTRVSPTGQILDPGGIPLHPGGAPAIASARDDYLVAWQGGAARVSGDGKVLDPGGLPISPLSPPAVASNGNRYIVVWTEPQSIYFAIIAHTGVVKFARLKINSDRDANYFHDPTVIWSGSVFVVVWARNTPSDAGSDDFIYATTVSAASGVGVPGPPVPAEGTDLYGQSGGEHFALGLSPTSQVSVVYGCLRDLNATDLDICAGQGPYAGGPDDQRLPAMAANATSLVWVNRSASSGLATITDGTRTIATGDHPAVTEGPPGHVALVYDRAGGLFLRFFDGTAHDNFANPQGTGGFVGSGYAVTVGATGEAGEPAHAGNPAKHSVWFRWTAPASGQVTIDTIDSTFDTVLGVYTGSSLSGLVPIASNDNGPSPPTSLVRFNAIAGHAYRVAVDGKNGVTGVVALNWFEVDPSAPPIIGIAPTSGPGGAALGALGSHFRPHEPVKLFYKTGLASPGTVLVCSGLADASGNFGCSGSIPTTNRGAVGAHTIVAKGDISLAKAEATFTLTS